MARRRFFRRRARSFRRSFRRRSFRRFRRRAPTNSLMKFRRVIFPAAFGLSFLQQITEKDIAFNTSYNNYDPLTKLKFIFGTALGRATGFYIFPQLTGSRPFQLNPKNIINKWTGLGLGAIVASYLPFPNKGGIKSIMRDFGVGALVGGSVGGILDDPVMKLPGQTQMQQQAYSDSVANASMNYSSMRGAL